MGGNRDATAEAGSPCQLDQRGARVVMGDAGGVAGRGRHQPAGAGQRQLGDELRIRGITILGSDAEIVAAPQGLGVEIHPQHPHPAPLQAHGDRGTETSQPEQDHRRTSADQTLFCAALPRGAAALEDAQQRLAPGVELVRVGDHVGGQGDGHQADQGHQVQRLGFDMAEGDPHGDEDQRELADLRHGEPGQKAGALAVAHGAHDGKHDQRIADQHEQRKHQGGGQVGAEQGQIEGRAQGDEEEQQQEIPQRRQPCRDGLAIRCRGQGDARQQAAHFLAEPDEIADRREQGGLGDGEDHQQLRRPRQALGQRRGRVAHEQHHQRHQPQARGQYAEDVPSAMAFGGADADRRQHDHRQHHHQVLHDQKTERNLAVQGVDLPFVGEQLDDDDGGGKGQRHRHVEAGDRRQTETEADQIAEDRGEGHLPEPGRQRHRPQGPDQLHVELDAHQKQQHRDAELGQQVDLVVRAHHVQPGGTGEQTDGDETHDQRLAQRGAQQPDAGSEHQQHGDLAEGSMDDISHGTSWLGKRRFFASLILNALEALHPLALCDHLIYR